MTRLALPALLIILALVIGVFIGLIIQQRMIDKLVMDNIEYSLRLNRASDKLLQYHLEVDHKYLVTREAK